MLLFSLNFLFKVTSNAIRSIGHLVVAILTEGFRASAVTITWDVDAFAQEVVLALSKRVSSVPCVISGSNTTKLSWKQRSSIKKHGRVACNSLALMLQLPDWAARHGVSCQIALKSIFKCVDCLGTSLDEKIIIAAMLAFQALPSSSLAKVSGRSCLVGKALVSCIAFLSKVRSLENRFKVITRPVNLIKKVSCLILKEQWSKGDYLVSSGKLLLRVDLLCEHWLRALPLLMRRLFSPTATLLIYGWNNFMTGWT